MSTSFVSLLTFISATLLAVSVGSLAYDYFFRYRLTIRERLKQLSSDDEEEGLSLFKDLKRLSNSDDDIRESWEEWLERLHVQAGAKWSLSSFAMLSLGGGLGVALLGFLGSWWLSILCAPFGLCLPLVLLLVQRRIRRRRLSRQLPEAFEMISRAVRAGQTIPAAMQIIAQDFDPPVCDEFRLCYEQQNLGISRETALKQLARRTGSMELQIFVVALLIQAKSGGDLVELLDNLASMNRKRLKLAERVRALTGEGRMQAIVLTILPVIAFIGVIVLSPDYAKILLDRPSMLLCTAVAQLVGTLWVRRIVSFDY
jgi:tight adherence protein B